MFSALYWRIVVDFLLPPGSASFMLIRIQEVSLNADPEPHHLI